MPKVSRAAGAKRAPASKAARSCRLCGAQEEVNGAGYTTIAPCLGLCADCINRVSPEEAALGVMAKAPKASPKGSRSKRWDRTTKTRDAVLAVIAKATMGFETLDTRRNDSMDFRDVAVWSAKEALERSFVAGRLAGECAKVVVAEDLARVVKNLLDYLPPIPVGEAGWDDVEAAKAALAKAEGK